MANLSNRSKGLLNHVSEINKILFENFYNILSNNPLLVQRTGYDQFTIQLPSTINVLTWEELEPIATYCIKRNVTWKIKPTVINNNVIFQIIIFK